MNKEQIHEIIRNKHRERTSLTVQEYAVAEQYFTEDEMNCMVEGLIDHSLCFHPRNTRSQAVVLELDVNNIQDIKLTQE